MCEASRSIWGRSVAPEKVTHREAAPGAAADSPDRRGVCDGNRGDTSPYHSGSPHDGCWDGGCVDHHTDRHHNPGSDNDDGLT